MDEIQIRTLTADDWERVRSIYLDGIATGQATFEARAPSWAEGRERIGRMSGVWRDTILLERRSKLVGSD